MTDTPTAPAAPAVPPRRWRVTLARPAELFGERLSPMHRSIEVDDAGLAELGDAVATKTEIVEPAGQHGG